MEKRIKITIMLLIIIFVLGILIVKVYGYFSDVSTASGKQGIQVLDGKLDCNAYLNQNSYRISIANTGNVDNYIRIKVFSPVELVLQNSNWILQEDGYYYYSFIVKAGTNAEDLNLTIKNEYEKEKFNIVFIQETSKVLYNEDGSSYADWELMNK